MPTKHGKVLSWATDLDEKTLEQAQRCADLPFTEGHLALMPDAHFGYGATVGSVIPTKGAVVPYAVGVDIGCGMIAVETRLFSGDLPDDLSDLHDRFVRHIPAGMGKGHSAHESNGRLETHYPGTPAHLPERQEAKALAQFGSLGGGNHFVEVCLDERDRVWIVLHSGSRGIGKELAEQHIDTAKGLMKTYFIELSDPNLAYLVEGSAEFDAYIADMLWAQSYALGSREAMMDAALGAMQRFLGYHAEIEASRINCHHNFTERENHRGQNVWITRKGAIRARQGDLGIIPGSMGTGTYIVSGKGMAASYNSCSHGAGRRLGRKQAERELDPAEFLAAMKGIEWDEVKADQLLDEAPGAYKNIDDVMAAQADLVSVVHRLEPILNMKGTK